MSNVWVSKRSQLWSFLEPSYILKNNYKISNLQISSRCHETEESVQELIKCLTIWKIWVKNFLNIFFNSSTETFNALLFL